MTTLKEQFITALTHLGWERNSYSRCLKFIEFRHPSKVERVYVGRKGALRLGRNVTESRPVTYDRKRVLLHLAQERRSQS